MPINFANFRPIAGHVNICPQALSTHAHDQASKWRFVNYLIHCSFEGSSTVDCQARNSACTRLLGRPLRLFPAPGWTAPVEAEQEQRASTFLQPGTWLLRRGGDHGAHGDPRRLVDGRGRGGGRNYLYISFSFIQVPHPVHLLVTERVRNQGGDGTALTHWEKRLFENEAMTGTHTQNPVNTLFLPQYFFDPSEVNRIDENIWVDILSFSKSIYFIHFICKCANGKRKHKTFMNFVGIILIYFFLFPHRSIPG
jgi:hypothetical protein